MHENYHGVFHGKAINLARKLCQEYDNVLERYDALVLPTIVHRIPKIPEKDEIGFGKFQFPRVTTRVTLGILSRSWLCEMVRCICVCVGLHKD